MAVAAANLSKGGGFLLLSYLRRGGGAVYRGPHLAASFPSYCSPKLEKGHLSFAGLKTSGSNINRVLFCTTSASSSVVSDSSDGGAVISEDVKNEEDKLKNLGNSLKILDKLKNLDKKAGQIVEIWMHQEPDSLYAEEVDDGEPEPLILCSIRLDYFQQRPIILADTSQGKARLVSYINACMALADVVRMTLGPRGIYSSIHDDCGNTFISDDGATIMKLLHMFHPAAKILVDIAMSQDSEVGDGATTVVLLAGEFLKEAKPFIEDGVDPQNLIRSYRTASFLAIEKIEELAVSIEGKSLYEKRSLLAKCAATTLSSKLIGGEKEFFASMVVDSVLAIGNDDRLNMIEIKKVPGGTMRDSFLVNGVAFKKTFSYAGFEQQPKKFENPKILLLNIELELKSEKENAEIRLSDPLQYQSIVDAEWNIIYDKLDKCVKSGAKIVLSCLAIGDLGTQYFADRDIFCAGHVAEEDLQRVAAATGGTVQTSVNNVIDEVLGSCEIFEEKQVGNERFNIFSGCPSGQTATIVLRGGADQFIKEVERSLHDAIMIVRTAMNSTVVAGGGAIDMEISQYLRQHARTIAGKSQLFINSYAKALEVIPRQLCDNAGFDATDVLNKLRQKHALASGEGALYGVDINTGGIADSYANFVWEPAVVKINAINAATEAACLILSVDETVKNPKSESAQGEAAASAMGRGRGGGGLCGRGRGMRRR